MNVVRLLLCVGVSAGFVLLGACGKSEDVPPRYNQRLGDGPDGAPLGTSSVDLGILQDQSSYQPANFTSLPGVGRSAAAADSEEQAAVRQRMGDLLNAVFELDFDSVLEAFVPEQVAALKDHLSAMYETVDKCKVLYRTWHDMEGEQAARSTETEQAFSALLANYRDRLVDTVVNALTIQILDEENAALGVDLPRLREGVATLAQEFDAEIAQMPEVVAAMQAAMNAMAGMPGAEGLLGPTAVPTGAADAGAAAPPAAPALNPMARITQLFLPALASGEDAAPPELPTLPLKKTDGEWRIKLRFAFTQEQAQVVGDGLALVQDCLDRVTEKLDGVETPEPQTLVTVFMQTSFEMGGPMMELFARAQQVFGPAMEGVAEPAEPGADESRDEAGEEEEEAEDEPGPVMVP